MSSNSIGGLGVVLSPSKRGLGRSPVPLKHGFECEKSNKCLNESIIFGMIITHLFRDLLE